MFKMNTFAKFLDKAGFVYERHKLRVKHHRDNAYIATHGQVGKGY